MFTQAHGIAFAARALFAFALGLWLSGAGCLACCGSDSDMTAPSSPAATAHAAPAHCAAHAAQAAASDAAHESAGDAVSRQRSVAPCCGGKREVASAALKPRIKHTPPVSAAARVAPPLSLSHAALPCAHDARVFFLDRGGTHARLCVFLI